MCWDSDYAWTAKSVARMSQEGFAWLKNPVDCDGELRACQGKKIERTGLDGAGASIRKLYIPNGKSVGEHSGAMNSAMSVSDSEVDEQHALSTSDTRIPSESSEDQSDSSRKTRRSLSQPDMAGCTASQVGMLSLSVRLLFLSFLQWPAGHLAMNLCCSKREYNESVSKYPILFIVQQL